MTETTHARPTFWNRPEFMLYAMAAGVPLSFAVWQALLNNFAIERAAFTGVEMGYLQGLREIPGFLSFAVVFLLLFVREQPLALVSLLLLGIGTAITGLFPSILGLYFTTILMSIGFHYYETLHSSLTLQWIPKEKAPQVLGRILSAKYISSIIMFGLIWFAYDTYQVDYVWLYLAGGGLTAIIAVVCWIGFRQFPQHVVQHKKMVLRRRYWLYYALTFMSGARRQIFVVFAGFLLVEKFGYSVADISMLFLVNAAISVWLAPRIGRLIIKWGERRVLLLEYVGLILVFSGYAFVDHAGVAAVLYVVDHLFFAMAIAMKTYFQKIADPADIASTSGVSFTISHIAAVVIPPVFGVLWLVSPAAVFLAGAAMAGVSLMLAFNVPRNPSQGNEVVRGRVAVPAPAE